MIVNPVEIARYTTEFYALSRSVRNATKMGESSALANFEQLVELGKSSKQLDANDSGVVQVVDWLWQYAFDQRASDIHLEPRRERSVIRFRIDGVMHTVYQLPPGVMSAMIARVKLLGRMDVVEKRRPLDGRIKVRNLPGDEVEMRLSTMPTAFGEKMVMRIFDPDTTVKTLESLGFGSHDGKRWEELVSRPHGIILVTGPTGSGKTTTLYSTLRRLATDEVNVCTIEDPIEMIQPAFNQTQVQPLIDLNFAEGLRALMRQDPDIIMVGEIRDLQTADMAIQASLTGHLVFSTLHTNDSASAITRLIDLGVAPYLIGSTLIGVLAQRLVRTLCPTCKVPDEEVTRETLHEVVKPWRLNGGVRPYKAVGCLECRMTGYRGRAGLYELLTVSDAARNFIQPHLQRGQAARPGAAGRPAAAAPGRRDEGRRGRDHARRSAARHARLGAVGTEAERAARCKPHGRGGPASLESGASQHRSEAQLRIKSERDFWAGLMFIAVGVIFAIGATNYSMGPACPPNDPCAASLWARMSQLSAHPGAGYFPLGLSIILAILGAIVLFKSLTIETEGGDKVGSFAWKPLIIIVIAIAVFGAMLEPIGMIITVPVLIFISSLAGDEFHWKGVADRRGRPDDRFLGDLRLGPEAHDPGAGRGSPAERLLNRTHTHGPAPQPRHRLRRRVHLHEPAVCLLRLRPRHADRRAAGHRPGRDDRDAAAVDLRARRDAGADHAGRHLLRRAVRRLDHRDPDQRAGRIVLGRDRDRRLPDGAPGPRRRRRSPPPASARSSPAASARSSSPRSRRRSPSSRSSSARPSTSR